MPFSTRFVLVSTFVFMATSIVPGAAAHSSEVPDNIVEILEVNCFGCHADGEAEGNFEADSLLELPIDQDSREYWHRVLKNVRSQIMPPADAGMMEPEELRALTKWIGRAALGLDASAPDPGRVTLQRLNRVEYRNTIQDLMGVDYETDIEFPADDSGHGFDNIGDVLSLSPLLLEKYLAAAETIVAQSVPLEPWTWPSRVFATDDMQRVFANQTTDPDAGSDAIDGRLSFFEPQAVTVEFEVTEPGVYRVVPDITIAHGFEYSPGQAKLIVTLDDQVIYEQEHAWSDKGELNCLGESKLEPGSHRVVVTVETTNPEQGDDRSLRFSYKTLEVTGPMRDDARVRPDNWVKFFDVDEAAIEYGSADHARMVIQRFGRRAYRRPLSDQYVDNIVELVASDLKDATTTFERSMAEVFVALLSSPRFVFRHEEPITGKDVQQTSALIDEYSLASRLSYFLWSTMPDEELMSLASSGDLRDNLNEQIDRMLADERSDAFVQNFVGQWLKTRDVESIPMDVLGASGLRDEYEALRFRLKEVFEERRAIARRDDIESEQAEKESREYREYEVRLLLDRIRELRKVRDELNPDVRRDLRQQTERLFEHVLRDDRSVLELIDNDYEFLNERLRQYYDLEIDEELEEEALRKVALPTNRRGGVLRQANYLIVTSNPTRTSPVKRGLFILDNILGTPAPPAPAAVPELEESADEESDREPALRELLERHRQDPLCASCHRRFDPMGLALENYDALGRWRDQDAGQAIDPAGELISGESFQDADELMNVLTGPRRLDFYRCLTEKVMTYALGRGIEYHDEPTIESIVQSLDADDRTPTIRQIIRGIVASPAFQRMRIDGGHSPRE